MKKFILFFLLLSILLNCNMSCDSKDCWRTYELTIPFAITPALDTFEIGDTLWLHSTIPNNMIDHATGENIFVENFDFKIRSIIGRTDTLINGNGHFANNDFIYTYQKGTFEIINLSTVSYINVQHSFVQDHQILEIGITPQKKGLYYLAFTNLTDDLKKVNLTDSDCHQNLNLSYSMNGNLDDNNYHLLQNSIAPINSSEGFKHDGGYAFFVK